MTKEQPYSPQNAKGAKGNKPLFVFHYSLKKVCPVRQTFFTSVFHYPLSIVITHLVVKFLLAAGCRIIWERWNGSRRPVLSWNHYVAKLAPAGIASALDIGLSNWSFEFITVSLYVPKNAF